MARSFLLDVLAPLLLYMSSRRGLPPAAGVILFLGTSAATAAVLGDPSSKPRRQIALRASEKRRDVLLRALSKRLLQQGNAQQQQETARLPQETVQESSASITISSPPTSESKVVPRFHVVTGPDANLTSLATERLSCALLTRRINSNHGNTQGLPLPARLVVPYGCAVGTGCLSSLVEEQLLLQPPPQLDDGHDSRHQAVDSQTSPTAPHAQHHTQQQQQQLFLEPSNTASGSQEEVETTERETADSSLSTGVSSSPDRRLATTEAVPSASKWDSLVLRATAAVMDAEQLDRDALWTLERVLSTSSPPALRTTTGHQQQRTPPFEAVEDNATPSGDDAFSSIGSQTNTLDETVSMKDGELSVGPLTRSPGDRDDTTTSESESQLRSTDKERTPAWTNAQHVDASKGDGGLEAGVESASEPHRVERSTFVLEIAWPDGEQAGEEADAAEKEGGERTGRRSRLLCGELARWGWRLASQGLGHVIVSSPDPWVLAELQGELQAEGERTSRSPQDGERGDDRPAAAATDGAEAGREVVVTRVALPSAAEQEQAVVSIAEELGVDHIMSALDISMLAEVTGGRRAGLLDALERMQGSCSVTVAEACQAAVDDQARTLATAWGLMSRDALASGSLAAHEHGATTNEDRWGGQKPGPPAASTDAARGLAVGGGGATAATRDNRKKWAALWETLAVLSLPRVAVSAAHTSAPSPAHGSMPPAELCEACEVDPDTLLRLTREMWLEVSPAVSPGSGTILRDNSPPPTATNNKGRLRRRRYRPPVTVHSVAVPLESLAHLDRSFVGAPPLHLAAFRRLVDSGTPPQHSKGVGESIAFGGAAGGVWGEAGEGVARAVDGIGSVPGEGGRRGASGIRPAAGRRDQQLERVGCLIEASVLLRMFEREGGKLSEDGVVLASDWTELGKARRDLRRHGRGDASEGEWAEVQLELIRQERAVAARAHEMRARRTINDTLEREILGLEKRATTLSGSPPPQEDPYELSRPPPPMPPDILVVKPTDRANTDRFSTNAEEAVIKEAEGGVRLMPLQGGVEEAGARDRVGEKKPVGGGGDRWGYGGRLWRWIRRA